MASKRPAKRSAAAKRGWETRKANERARALEARRAAKKRQLANRKKQDTKAKKKSAAWVEKQIERQVQRAYEAGKRAGVEETKKTILTGVFESYFGKEETPEERQARMQAMWRESEGIRREPFHGYINLLRWVQRNGFIAREFWAEYRRRHGVMSKSA